MPETSGRVKMQFDQPSMIGRTKGDQATERDPTRDLGECAELRDFQE